MKQIFRALIVIFVIYASVMAIMGVQYLFDRGDMKKAVKVVYNLKPNQNEDKTLTKVMADTLSITEEQLYCETQIISRYEGRVLVECGNKATYQSLNSKLNFQWEVDVIRGGIKGRNVKAQRLIVGQAIHD